jgi:hypothetical protein
MKFSIISLTYVGHSFAQASWARASGRTLELMPSLALPKPVASCDTDKVSEFDSLAKSQIHQISRVRMRTSVCKLFWSVESKMTGIRRCW